LGESNVTEIIENPSCFGAGTNDLEQTAAVEQHVHTVNLHRHNVERQ